MDTSNFDSKIAELKQMLSDLKTPLEATSHKMIQGLCDDLASWCASSVASYVRTEPKITNKLSDEQLAELKKDSREIADRMVGELRTELQKPSYWVHAKEPMDALPDNYRCSSGSSPTGEKAFSLKSTTPIYKALSAFKIRIAELLERYGYISKALIDGQRSSFDRAVQGFSVSAATYEAFEEYLKPMQNILIWNNRIHSLENEKEKAISQDRWDKA